MNILLIRPPFPEGNMAVPAQPLAIAYLAAYIREQVPQVKIGLLDAVIDNLSEEAVFKRISKFHPDVVGFSYLTPQADFVYHLSRQIKNKYPQMIIVHGGVHPTCLPEESIQYSDYCVIGEGEITFNQLLRAIDGKRDIEEIAGLMFKKNARVINTGPRDFISDIDRIPYPAWDLLPMERYKKHTIHINRQPAVGIMASRGCPFNCSFCASPIFWKQKVRFRTPGNIISEIKEVINNYGINNFHFYDDNLLLDNILISDVCNLILKEKLQILWACLGKISLIKNNPEILSLMHEAGCRAIELGVESFDDEVLSQIGKRETTRDILDVFKLVRDSKIKPLMLLMTFNPGETLSGWYFQAQGLRQIEPEASTFIGQFATPYPGTEFDRNCGRLGIKLSRDWKDYSTSQINFIPYSLLQDVPVQTTRDLSPKYVLRVVITSLYQHNLFSKVSLFKKLKMMLVLTEFTLLIHKLCRSQSTLEDIAAEISQEKKIDYTLSLEMVSFLALLLAQLGLIKSRDSQRLVAPYPDIFLNQKFKKNIYIFLAYLLVNFSLIFKHFFKNTRVYSFLITDLFGRQ
jgi:radical SAM superfamily enzyme YgiQ (UPF0313 family)